jgi:hypothetical protein
MKKTVILFSLIALCLSTVEAQTKLVSATEIGVTSANLIGILAGQSTYDVRSYKITYNTTDVDGSATVASGLLSVPIVVGCTEFPLGAYCHGTVLEKENVPSRDNSEAFVAKAIATEGIIAVAPDYLGLGDNAGLHPYLHAESQATATLDLMRAVREFLPDSLGITLNGECFFSGYSQGGHAAMASVKYIQDNNLQTEFNIVAAGPASGPYNLSGSQSEVLLSNQPYTNPGYVCYLLFGLNRVYGNIYNNYDEILKAPYDTLIPPYFDGTYPMDSVNAKLPMQINGFLQDSVLANVKADSVNKTHPIWQALLAQDNYDWNPAFPMRLYYCTLDEQVSFQNALDAEAAMTTNGATGVTAVNQGAFNHSGCVTPSLFDARDYFKGLATACVNIGVDEKSSFEKLTLFPNPARDHLSLSGLAEEEVNVTIYNLSGAVLMRSTASDETTLDIRSLPQGLYLLSVRAIFRGRMFPCK